MKRLFLPIIFFVIAIIGSVIFVGYATFERRFAQDVVNQITNPAFYTVPSDIPEADPGTIYRSERLYGAPNDATAWRVLYHSRDTHDKNIIVSAVVVVPNGQAPEGGRTVVAWGHPTTGIVERCAPSVGIDPFILMEGLQELLKAGYVVVATDYSNMGVSGPYSFLIGETEGYNMIDAVRATRGLKDVRVSNEVVMWGHSQGGHAALFAGQLIGEYAPELSLKAVATAAPATDLTELLDADIGDVSGITIGSYAFTAYSSVYTETPGTALDTILTDRGVENTPKMANMCLIGQNSELHKIASPMIGLYLKNDPAMTEPWKTLLTENTPGATRLNVPLFIAQGEEDKLVRPNITGAFAEKEKALGTDVTYLSIPNTGHGMVANRAIPHVVTWLKDLK